ncbi:TPA: hypothetical protein N0F65_000299 [Lagenidium giganteum]|uniref:CS domain-containing protein n=1 Tax=Lagenidium giganteum TaxID=4803 RepID=A0AAV2Z9F3_9STRA|nr:TPA: hypothetical protein N0F65_000299 [Lagenidium giganteum]
MVDWFIPYVYVPSPYATYVKIVTPWGSMQVEQMVLMQVAGAVVVVVLTAVAYYVCGTTAKVKPEDKAAQRAKAERAERASRTEAVRSALEDNIIKKGENSYYYAHNARQVKDSDEPELTKTMVSSYGWTDKKKQVSIYLTDRIVEDMAEDQLKLKWTTTSLKMDLLLSVGGKEAKSLVIPTLYGEITDVTWRRSKDRLTLTLHKAEETEWKSLNAAAKHMDEHIEYDESLYD